MLSVGALGNLYTEILKAFSEVAQAIERAIRAREEGITPCRAPRHTAAAPGKTTVLNTGRENLYGKTKNA
jgi:hypothetical protein